MKCAAQNPRMLSHLESKLSFASTTIPNASRLGDLRLADNDDLLRMFVAPPITSI